MRLNSKQGACFTPAAGWLLSPCLTQPAGIHILPEERTKSMQLLVNQARRHTVTQHIHRLDPGEGRPNPKAPSKHTVIHVGAEDRTSFCLQLSATSPEQLGKGSKVLPSARPAALPAKHNRHAVQLGAPSIFSCQHSPSRHEAACPCSASILTHPCGGHEHHGAWQGQADGGKPHLQQELSRKRANQATNAIRVRLLQLASPLTCISRVTASQGPARCLQFTADVAGMTVSTRMACTKLRGRQVPLVQVSH